MALWTPFDLGGKLVAWWDAQETATIVLNGSKVVSWTDRKGGYVASQTNDALRVNYSATARNGKAGLVNSATNQTMTFNSTGFPLGDSARTIALSSYLKAAGSTAIIFFYGSSTTGQLIGAPKFSNLASYTDWGNYALNFNDPTNVDTFLMWHHPGGGGVDDLFFNSLPSDFAGPWTTNTVGTLGGFFDQIMALPPDIGSVLQQVVVCNAVLTVADRQKLEGWDSWWTGKNGANLPAGHPYKASPPQSSGPLAYTLTASSYAFPFTGRSANLTYVPAPNSYVLSASAGAIPFAAISANLVYTTPAYYVLSPSAGSFAYAGISVRLNLGYQLTSASGVFPFTGNDVDLPVEKPAAIFDLSLSPGAFPFDAGSADLVRAIYLNLDTDGFPFTGYVADLHHTIVYLLEVNAAAYPFDAYQALLAYRQPENYVMVPESATFPFAASITGIHRDGAEQPGDLTFGYTVVLSRW